VSSSWGPNVVEKQLDKPMGVRIRAPDVRKCRERLGWVPSYSLHEGVERTTNGYLDAFGGRDTASLERLLMERA
jgi:nucleoside-diphosphate-sugar epimerase